MYRRQFDRHITSTYKNGYGLPTGARDLSTVPDVSSLEYSTRCEFPPRKQTLNLIRKLLVSPKAVMPLSFHWVPLAWRDAAVAPQGPQPSRTVGDGSP